MFTGIIQSIQKIKKISKENGSFFIHVVLPKKWKVKMGESISINGICSTVRKVSENYFEVEYMPETISKTAVSGWAEGDVVNLEKSLKLNDLVSGHLVSGHIDGVAKIMDVEEKGNSKIIMLQAPRGLLPCIAPKGSVALDGVSLTVVNELDDSFTVSLVSYTLSNTNFINKKIGDLVNIETDLIAKYIFNILKNAETKK